MLTDNAAALEQLHSVMDTRHADYAWSQGGTVIKRRPNGRRQREMSAY